MTVIEIDNLWKKYRLGVLGTGTLRHDFNRWWHRVRGLPDPYAKVGETRKTGIGIGKPEMRYGGSRANGGVDFVEPPLADDEMWALRGVSFEVKRGEILGVIGRNGAGKSTLLKVLSRVTAPTSGRVRVRGRIASLLEVGTGFNPELTGRENTFLNGAILGMSKAEIKRKFDEIVAFADIEKFIDTPVKRYSSGMYVRLAFAVAAHLEPEILIVDEVLAVGDAQFQRKCLGKMEDVSKGGRTILFVSHNMATVRQLCSRAILLSQGRLESSGRTGDVVDAYLAKGERQQEQNQFTFRHRSDNVSLTKVAAAALPARFGGSLELVTEWEVKERTSMAIECVLRDAGGAALSFYGTGVMSGYEFDAPPGRHEVRLSFPSLPLAEGAYYVDIIAARTNKEFIVYAESAFRFEIEECDPCASGLHYRQGNGSVFLPCKIESNLARV